MNYDGYNFGFAGAQTTDTTDPNTIRFGAIVGTFVETNPSRNDWFFIGTHQILPVPNGGGTLYLAVLDTLNSNNVGYFDVNVAPVPEPATAWLFGTGLIGLMGIRRKLKR